jgi:hypothetical protein
MSAKRKKAAKKKDSKLQSSAEKSLKSINSTSTVKTSVVGILNNPNTSILPDIAGVSLFPNSSLIANGSIGISGIQSAYIPTVNPLNISSSILPNSRLLSIANDGIAKLASFSALHDNMVGKTYIPSTEPMNLMGGVNQTASVYANGIYNDTKREAEKREEEKRKIKLEEDRNNKLDELIKVAEQPREKIVYEFNPHGLISDNRFNISDSLRVFAEKIERTKSWINWHCAFCSKFLSNAPRLKNFETIEMCYAQFAQGKYENCEKCDSENFFFMQNERIFFCCAQSLGSDPTKFVSKHREKEAKY